jgi:hypothetical protein
VRTGVCGRPGEARASKIARSSVSDISEGYGLKTFSNCLVSRLAFFMSLFAHSPPLVLRGGGVFVSVLGVLWLSTGSSQ